MSEKYEFIDAQYAAYQESAAGTAVKRENVQVDGSFKVRVSTNGGRGRKAQRRKGAGATQALIIRKAFDDSDGTYGYRRVWAQLARWGVRAGLELVRALMRELGLVACQPRPWRPATTQQGEARARSPTW